MQANTMYEITQTSIAVHVYIGNIFKSIRAHTKVLQSVNTRSNWVTMIIVHGMPMVKPKRESHVGYSDTLPEKVKLFLETFNRKVHC